MGGTLIKLKELKESFTKNENKISNYLEDNIEEIKILNTYELAVRCGVSQASVVRFSKKLGFKGFPEFRIALAADVATVIKSEEVNIIYDGINFDDNVDMLSKKIVYENVKTIEDTYKILDFGDLEKAVEIIDSADRIFLLGAGFSGIVAKDFQYKLWELGKSVICDTDQHIQLANASTVSEKDVVFVISHSGKTLDIYQTLLKFKKNKATVITLTKCASNPIKSIGDICLNTVVEKTNFRSTSLSSRMAQLTVIDILYVKLIQNNRTRADKFIGTALKNVESIKMD